MRMRGSSPSWIACLVTENAAVISACEAHDGRRGEREERV